MERYVLQTDAEIVQSTFGVMVPDSGILSPTFNAAPGHTLPIIAKREQGIFSAFWESDSSGIHISTKDRTSLFADAQPCIIPANGFYMWKQTVNDPLPFYVRIHSRKLLGIAGVLITRNSRVSFRVLTRASGVLLNPLSETMPCILEPNEYDGWLNGSEGQILAKGFSHNLFIPDMTVYRVPDLVNDLSNNAPELIQPIPKLREED